MSLDQAYFSAPESSATLPRAAVPRAPSRSLQCVATIALIIIIMGGFGAVGMWNAYRAASGMRFSSLDLFSWDNAIPRVSAWAWIYILFYPALLLPFAFSRFRQDLEIFLRLCVGYLLQVLICLPLFIMPIRIWHSEVTGDSASDWLLRLIYSIDTGFNVFPSMHVTFMSFLACFGTRFGGRKAGLAMWTFCGLIMASTLFTKQHYILDLPAGFALGLATYFLAFRSSYLPFQNRTGPVSQ